MAQAPQGINYQAVAFDNLGAPVINQLVGVRLSVLDGSATGPVLYEETQVPSTDNTGLFSIVIGNGTITSGTFSAINWGKGTKWLKTEIDITGGTNYVVMGSSQFMSAPYAFYSDKAGYASKTGFSSGSFTMPDGFDNVTTVVIPDSVNYTVPPGKNLYVPTSAIRVNIDGHLLSTNVTGSLNGLGADAKTFVGASENSVVALDYIDRPIACFLVGKKVEWRTVDYINSTFSVPADKQFVIINSIFYTSIVGCKPTLNGNDAVLLSNTILEPNTIISSIGCPVGAHAAAIINGYFMDK